MNGSAFPFGTRGAGLLLHVSSLPSPWGVGDFGPPALAWIDRLVEAGQGWWQFLPLGPPGRGNSPYEPFSTFAINELFISPEWLIEDGLLNPREAAAPAFSDQTVEYETVGAFKLRLLEQAHDSYRSSTSPDLRSGFRSILPSGGPLARGLCALSGALRAARRRRLSQLARRAKAPPAVSAGAGQGPSCGDPRPVSFLTVYDSPTRAASSGLRPAKGAAADRRRCVLRYA